MKRTDEAPRFLQCSLLKLKYQSDHFGVFGGKVQMLAPIGVKECYMKKRNVLIKIITGIG